MRYRKTGSKQAVATELASLRWLAAAQGAAVADIEGEGPGWLATRMLESTSPTSEDAATFGRKLAVTHAAGADWFGQPPDGLAAGQLRLAELAAPAASEPTWQAWGEFYAEARVRPYLGKVPETEVGLLHSVCDRIASGVFDAPQPAACGKVARIHGDLWNGNVVWAADEQVVGTLIDPCAHGGHAETDLAELALFGAPHLEAIISGYQEVSPLADGWRERVQLHQLHMVAVHVELFGGAYLSQLLGIARRLAA